MNDWLDYKGSGSSRAYSGDYVGNTISNTNREEKWWGSGDPTEISKSKTNSRNTRRR